MERLLPLFQEILFKLDLALELLTSPQTIWNGLKGKLVDISGSGLQFECRERISVSSFLELRFQLPGQWGRQIQCAGKVNRVEEREEGSAVACEFTHICEGDREKIIQFVFQVSSKMLREIRKKEDGDS